MNSAILRLTHYYLIILWPRKQGIKLRGALRSSLEELPNQLGPGILRTLPKNSLKNTTLTAIFARRRRRRSDRFWALHARGRDGWAK